MAERLLWRGLPIWGIFLIVLGCWWLGAEAGIWQFDWGFAGPLAVIAAGSGMLIAWRGK